MRGVRQKSATLAAFSVLYLTVGWTAGAWLSSRLQDRWRGESVSLLGALIAFPATVAIAGALHVDAALPVVYGAFAWLGVGVGTITSTGAALLQNRTDLAEMGRLNGAHQFLRTISLTVGIAAMAAITLAIVDQRIGEVENVRELLSDDPKAVPEGLIGALSHGYAWAATAAVVIAAMTIPAAIHLFSTRRPHINSSL